MTEPQKKSDSDNIGYTDIIELKTNMLKVGDNIQIKPLSDTLDTTQYYVKYLGGLEKKSLICTLPMEGEKIVFIKENSAFSVRLFSGKNVYVFSSVVETVFSRPYPHLHFKYPKQVHVNKLRRNQRVDVTIIAAMSNISDTQNILKSSGHIDNISMRGALFSSPKAAGLVGDAVECSFKVKMGSGEALFVIPSIIRSVNQNKHQSGKVDFQHGIEFSDIVFQEKILLQNYIFQCVTGENIDDI